MGLSRHTEVAKLGSLNSKTTDYNVLVKILSRLLRIWAILFLFPVKH